MPRQIDVLIIGAGINGAGLFRDLCEQGLNCIIIDKGDFGSGTSAAPSRLIHGGIKYLETGELRLVAQSTLERNLLLQNAPHLVKPLPTVIPIFSWFKGISAALRTLCGATTAPRARGAVLIKIGLAMYDFYGARHRVMPRHKLWSKRTALREIPPLTPAIVAAGTYYDATIRHPERLVLELLQDGMRARPASQALNYTALTCDHDVIRLSPQSKQAQDVIPKIIINAAGPWIDQVNQMLGHDTCFIGGTKGSHILLDHPALIDALKGRMIYFEADDGRICLVFDYLGRALVGSTDIRAGDPDHLQCDDDEIDYFIHSLQGLFPALAFSRDHIIYSYSGIRPLPASDSANPGLISRDHSSPEITGGHWPIISLVGGKWTTFRGFAEEIADDILQRLNHPRRIGTRMLPIGGGKDYPNEAQKPSWIARISTETGASPERTALLLARYGTTAPAILRHEQGSPPLTDAPDYSAGEIDWLLRHEQVVHLDDLVLRRTTLAITGRLTMKNLRQIADLAADVLNRSPEQREAELGRTITALARHHYRLLS